jgi:hypothetical protein
LSQVTPTGTPDGTNYLRDDNRWAIPAPLTVQDFGDPFVLPDTSALTIPLRFAVSDANRLTAKAGARLSVLGTNPVLLGYYALGSCQIDADAYALQYKRASLLGSARATVIGTGELFVFDLAPVGRLVLAGRGG